MQTSTLFVLLCVVAAACAYTHYELLPASEVEAVHIPEDAYEYDTPAHERSPRTKRGLLLLKKKLLLGALGLKAAKVGAVGAGVAALALKKKHSHAHQSVPVVHASTHTGYSSHGPSWNVEVNSWH